MNPPKYVYWMVNAPGFDVVNPTEPNPGNMRVNDLYYIFVADPDQSGHWFRALIYADIAPGGVFDATQNLYTSANGTAYPVTSFPGSAPNTIALSEFTLPSGRFYSFSRQSAQPLILHDANGALVIYEYQNGAYVGRALAAAPAHASPSAIAPALVQTMAPLTTAAEAINAANIDSLNIPQVGAPAQAGASELDLSAPVDKGKLAMVGAAVLALFFILKPKRGKS